MLRTIANNTDLNNAGQAKKDEFYTQLNDIEKELKYYKEHFRNKVVYCNCDDPKESGFYHYFSYNFEHLGLKKLITTCYKSQSRDIFTKNDSEKAIFLEYKGNINDNRVPDVNEIGVKYLNGDGDFRSQECIELLKEADIVVTNPPFSLFREYISQLIEYNKKFIIVGNINAVTYKNVFPLIKEDNVWLGKSIKSGDREFRVPNHYPLNAAGNRTDDNGNRYIRVKGVRWYTNVEYSERKEDLLLYKKYSADEYPNYDNYNAINVDKTKDIPYDYKGIMGVPITFLDKYNPDQFSILGITDRQNTSGLRNKVYTKDDIPSYNDLNARSVIKSNNNYRAVYARVLIKNKRI